jgi:ribosomal protein S12 methylthiotransferase accessory factor
MVRNFLPKLVSPYSLISRLRANLTHPTTLPIYVFSADVPLVRKMIKSSSIRDHCTGGGFSYEEALLSAIGEAVERYAWLLPKKEGVVFAPINDPPNNHISIFDAGLLFPEQYSQNRIQEELQDIKIPWFPSKNLIDGKTIFVPVPDLYIYTYPLELSSFFISTTNGLAAHPEPRISSLHAIYEVIERDATMQFWYKKVIPKKEFLLETTDSSLSLLLRKIYLLGLELKVFDITTDIGIPTILAIIQRSEEGKECIACGSACRIDVSQAVRKAIIEAASLWNALPYLKEEKKPFSEKEIEGGFPNVSDLDDHVYLYTFPWAKEGYRFILDALPIIKKEKLQTREGKRSISLKELKQVLTRIEEKGYKALVMDITPSDVSKLGFKVMKAVIPGFVPMFVGHYKNLFSSRLSKDMVKNKWPHPFP